MADSTGQTAPGAGGEIEIRIDRHTFWVPAQPMSASVLRQLPTPPLGSEVDLFQMSSGSDSEDLLIGADQIVDFENGTNFFSAPTAINAGSCLRLGWGNDEAEPICASA